MFQRVRSPWFLASMAWIGLLLIFFFPVVFQGKVLAPLDILDHLMRPWSDGAGGFGVHNAFVYDAISQYLPYDWTVCQSLEQDGYIGWNPYVYGGYALLENTMLCPGDWHHQLYRFFDFWTAWDLGIVLQFAIAGFGVLVMLRNEGIPAWAALLGAVSFAFYSQHVLWIYHRWVLGASCWFPWIVWAIRRARHRNRLVDFWSVVFTALAFRGGHLQSCLFVATLVLCLFLSDWWKLPDRWRFKVLLRTALPYCTLAFFSSFLILDILLNTVPPYLEGCRELPRKGFLKALLALPTLVTTLHPTLFGTPQTLDGFKAFGCDLFDLKFAGALPVLLALFAAFRKQAPLLPRLLFWIGLLIPFTPLIHWFYSRSTVLFALGCAWLAAWTLAHLSETIPVSAWRRIARLSSLIVALWTLASGGLLLLTPRLAPFLHRFVEKGLSSGKASRHDWMLARADAFLAGLPVWNVRNLVPLILVTVGLFAVWKISSAARRRSPWCAILCFAVFGELFVWSRTWITFSVRPERTDRLYADCRWTEPLLRELAGAGFLYEDANNSDFDFFQLNVQSGLSIPSLQDYETIMPRHLPIPATDEFADTNRLARLGISHVLARSNIKPNPALAGWRVALRNKDFVLYRNPAFRSRWIAVLADSSEIPCEAQTVTLNSFTLQLPATTISLHLAMNHHPAWRYRLDNDSWRALPESPDGLHAAEIKFSSPLPASATIFLRFSNP